MTQVRLFYATAVSECLPRAVMYSGQSYVHPWKPRLEKGVATSTAAFSVDTVLFVNNILLRRDGKVGRSSVYHHGI